MAKVLMLLRIITATCSEREQRLKIVPNDLAQRARSHLCDEGVGHLGKEPTDTSIADWIVNRTYSNAVMVLHTSYSLLRWVVGGFCSTRDYHG
jgi:hypothetical protein